MNIFSRVTITSDLLKLETTLNQCCDDVESTFFLICSPYMTAGKKSLRVAILKRYESALLIETFLSKMV